MNFLKIKSENDKIFKNNSYPDMQSEVFQDVTAQSVQRTWEFQISEYLICTDTISAILKYGRGKTIALNFANAMYAGGGYILGGNAQEEALCRASMLYYTIKTAKTYYHANRLHVLPDYTNHMIYSRNVPVIRDNSGNLLESPEICDFITCPAVNRTFAKFLFSQKKLNLIMEQRIENIIRLCAVHKPDVLILVAFGCGVFGNKREIVYPQFEKAINQYLSDEITIIFADPSANN